MFREIHKKEKTIRKMLQTGDYEKNFVEAANLYRNVSYIIHQSNQIRDKIYPDIREKFEEVFNEEDKLHSRALQIGDVLINLGKDSTRTKEVVDSEAILTALKGFLPEYAELIDQTYENNLQLARIQTNPSLYVLSKEHSDPKLLKRFEEAYDKFNKNPSVATLNESKGFSFDEFKQKGKDVIDSALRKLQPFFQKMLRTNKKLANKSEELYNKYLSGLQLSDTVVSEATTDDSPEHPHVSKIKRLSNKSIATVDEGSEFAKEIKGLATSYENLGKIIKRAEELKKEISSDMFDETNELFDEQERAYNSVIDLGEVLVAIGRETSRAGSKAKVMKSFIEELKGLIPEHEELIEDIYIMNKNIEEVDSKSRVSSKNLTEDTIEKMAKWVESIQRFVKKGINIIRGKTRRLSKKTRELKDNLKDVDGLVKESIFQEEVQNPTHYCVYQPGMAIFGVGKTEKDAWNDAEEWADTTEKDWKKSFKIAPCTTELYKLVKEKGTPDSWEETDGIQHL